MPAATFPHHPSTRLCIVAMRIAALIVVIATVGAIWNFMMSLPWQVDCAIAGAAAFAFAYKFERQESQ